MISQLDRIKELEEFNNYSLPEAVPKTLAITSGKGGTGKTFLSANLAYLFSLNKNVLLIDLDFNLSNLQTLFNYSPRKTLSSFFNDKMTLAQIITKYNPHLDIVFGDAGLVSDTKPSGAQLKKLFFEISNVKDNYDIVIFDLGAGASEENLNVLSNALIKLIITNPEPTALMDAYVIVKLLKAEANTANIFVTLNRCLDNSEAEQSFNNLKAVVDHFLKTEIHSLGSVPESIEVRKSIIDQKLLAAQKIKSDVIDSLLTLIKKINKIPQLSNINQSIHQV